MAEVREMIETFRRGGSMEELIALMTMMQGQLDANSFIAGMLLGRSAGRGMDRSAALLLALTASSANAQQQTGGGTVTTNPMQQLLPLLLLLGRDDWDDFADRKVEIIEKKAAK